VDLNTDPAFLASPELAKYDAIVLKLSELAIARSRRKSARKPEIIHCRRQRLVLVHNAVALSAISGDARRKFVRHRRMRLAGGQGDIRPRVGTQIAFTDTTLAARSGSKSPAPIIDHEGNQVV